jgi:rhamnosyltransferase
LPERTAGGALPGPATPEGAAAGAPDCADVTAVVVTYQPDLAALRALVAQLLAQAGRVIVVDNASDADIAASVPADARLTVQRNAANLGIAAAQNLGMLQALQAPACRYVLLADGDSLPAPAMVARLRAALEDGGAAAPVAAAGPLTIDQRTGEAAAVLVDEQGRRTRRTLDPDDAPPVQEVGFLIASGSLIPVTALRALRGMRSNYFIDHVDTEWCFRARAAGYRLLLVPQARLYHRLGDAVRRIGLRNGRPVAYHAPLRDYYSFRNTLLMHRDTAISVHWRCYQLLRLAQFAAYYLVLGDLRRQRLRFMWLGLRHGLGRVSGHLVAGTTACTAIPATPLDPVS